MTKGLDEFFNLPATQASKSSLPAPQEPDDMDPETRLLDVRQHELDMDKLAVGAMETFEKIMDIADNVDERNVASVLSSAIQMYRNAIDAKDSKARYRLQTAQLLLRKRALDEKAAGDDADVISDPALGAAVKGDFNSILDAINGVDLEEVKKGKNKNK